MFTVGDIVKLKSFKEVSEIAIKHNKEDLKALSVTVDLFQTYYGDKYIVRGIEGDNIYLQREKSRHRLIYFNGYQVNAEYFELVEHQAKYIFVMHGDFEGNFIKYTSIDEEGNYIWENPSVGTVKFKPEDVKPVV